MEAVAKNIWLDIQVNIVQQGGGETLLFELRGRLNEIHCKYILAANHYN